MEHHSQGSVWLHRGKTEKRIQPNEVDAHVAVGFALGRIPGRTQADQARQSRIGIAKTLPGRLVQHGVTVESFRDAKAKGLKWCTAHKRFEEPSLFYVGTKLCREASTRRNSIDYAKNGVSKKNHVSKEWYDAKLTEQGGHCALCPATVGSVRNPRFCFDHDHSCCKGRWSCGKCLRGLLCNQCNYKVAMLEQIVGDWQWAKTALEYAGRRAA